MPHLVSPTILVVDDERRFGAALKRQLLNQGSIGSIVCDNLDDAANYLTDSTYKFDALVTDYMFETGDAPARHLLDGLDLIEFAAKHCEGLTSYAVSAYTDAHSFRKKVADRRISVKHIFDKRNLELKSNQPSVGPQPWTVLRLDVYRQKLDQDEELAKELREELQLGEAMRGEELLGRILDSVRPPTMTYLQELNSRLRVIRPIEVLCIPDPKGQVRATATKLGLLVDGFGTTPHESIENLKEVIVDHAESLLSDKSLVGYAAAVRNQLREYMEKTRDE